MDYTPSFGHGITFGRTAYVASVGAEMLDLIESSGLSISMTGDGLVATTHEALKEFVADKSRKPLALNPKTLICWEFLGKMLTKIDEANAFNIGLDDGDPEPIGEIIFSK